MAPENNYLFNFSASYSGGGYKRLYEYAKWFQAHGHTNFVVHPNCRVLSSEFPGNRYFEVAPTRVQRLFDDCGYLQPIVRQIGIPTLYYSYGIPLYSRCGSVNWFHLSNVLPLERAGIPLPLYDRVRLNLLERRIVASLHNADVVSGESQFSVDLLARHRRRGLMVSVNGSDDELAHIQGMSAQPTQSLATAVGTNSHKALGDTFRLFAFLKQRDARLELRLIGDPALVPASLRAIPGTALFGVLARPAVIESLRNSRYYLSTTLIENSYNAAAEGIFIADESYISDIGPHRELLAGMPFETIRVPGIERPLLHVHREQLTAINLRTWDQVIRQMIASAREALTTAKSGGGNQAPS